MESKPAADIKNPFLIRLMFPQSNIVYKVSQEEISLLRYSGDPVPQYGSGYMLNVCLPDPDYPLIRQIQLLNQRKQGGFTSSAFTQNGCHLIARYAKLQPPENLISRIVGKMYIFK